MGRSLLQNYFPDLTEDQLLLFQQFEELFLEWNSKINLISRKDQENLSERHVLHSLGIAKVCSFLPGTKILDVGTGGGFPGIPLAILFPETEFVLIDSIGKKIKVVNEIANELKLHNVKGFHTRAQDSKGTFDFIVSRAVTALPHFIPWVKNKINTQSKNELKNGILYLKGGDLREELAAINYKTQIYSLSDFFKEEFFETKKVVYVPLRP